VGCNDLKWSAKLNISRGYARSDPAAEARDRIVRHPHLAVQRIWCDYSDQTLFLHGHVPSFYLKQLAQTAVAGLDGVDQVVNEIEVLW
jgi:hypothetical protein